MGAGPDSGRKGLTMKTRIGITSEHCGRYCTAGCANLAVDAVRAILPGQEVVAEDCGPWPVDQETHAAIEAAIDAAGHAPDCGSDDT